MSGKIFNAACGVAVVVLISFAWHSNEMLQEINKEGLKKMNKIENHIVNDSKQACAEVDTKCGVVLRFYQQEGETAAEFAARIKAFVKEFEENWGD